MIKKPSGDRRDRDKKQQGTRGKGIGRMGYLEEF